jgi:hypothetical protein
MNDRLRNQLELNRSHMRTDTSTATVITTMATRGRAAQLVTCGAERRLIADGSPWCADARVIEPLI